MNSGDVSIFVAFLAGILTFFSPCVLPLIPSYLAYITGSTVNELAHEGNKETTKKALISSIFFVLGFSIVFIALGIGISSLGKAFMPIEKIFRIVGGFLIIFFGLMIGGFIKLKFFEMEKRFTLKSKPLGYFGALVVGMAFSLGWVPCVGPILSSILIVAGTKQSVAQGFFLLSSYSLGLGLPIIASAVAFNYFLSFFGKIKQGIRYVSLISGLLLILLGILVITDNLTYLTQLAASIFRFKGI